MEPALAAEPPPEPNRPDRKPPPCLASFLAGAGAAAAAGALATGALAGATGALGTVD